MSDLINKIVTVKSFDSKEGKSANGPWRKFGIVDQDGMKYSFFAQKKDGTDTKAYQGFKAMGVTFDSLIGIAYKEEDKTFTDKKGKEQAYKQRTIVVIEPPAERREVEKVIQVEDENDVSNIPF